METTASVRGVRLSAQKGRLVADLVRGKPVDKALNILAFTQKKAAGIIKKALESAIANAEHNDGADIDELRVTQHLRREGSDAAPLLRARQGPRRADRQAVLSHLRDGRRRQAIGATHGSKDQSHRISTGRLPQLDVALVRHRQGLLPHAGRGPQGARVPEEEAAQRLGRPHPDRAPGQERAHHDLLGTPRCGHRQEGRGHRERSRSSCRR